MRLQIFVFVFVPVFDDRVLLILGPQHIVLFRVYPVVVFQQVDLMCLVGLFALRLLDFAVLMILMVLM